MDILLSLLPNDYYIKFEYLPNIDCIYTGYYVENLKKIISFNENSVKPKDIIERLYFSIGNKIDMFYNNEEFFDNEDVAFSILFEQSDSEKENIKNEILSTVKSFYNEHLKKDIDVDINNIKLLLENPISKIEHTNIVCEYYSYCLNLILQDNSSIIRNITQNFNKKLLLFDKQTINSLEIGWDNVKYRLFIFFKVLGKDFDKFISNPIFMTDPFSIMFIKFNKLLILNLKIKLYEYWSNYQNEILSENITNEEACLLLFMFCKNNDCKGNFIDIYSLQNYNSLEIYKRRSIRMHNLFRYT